MHIAIIMQVHNTRCNAGCLVDQNDISANFWSIKIGELAHKKVTGKFLQVLTDR